MYIYRAALNSYSCIQLLELFRSRRANLDFGFSAGFVDDTILQVIYEKEFFRSERQKNSKCKKNGIRWNYCDLFETAV